MRDNNVLLLMLEDDSDRLQRFASILDAWGSQISFLHWRTAKDFIAGYQAADHTPHLICLDHDLFVDHVDDPDPGDGRDVAEFLATQEPCCRIVIHSSNVPAANSMLFTLSDAGWDVVKIAPIGDDWIESYWFPIVKRWLEPRVS